MGIVDMHRPENWGQVKFTKAEEKTAFIPARDPETDTLLGVYYAQKDFREKNKRWAGSTAELKSVSRKDHPGVQLRKTEKGYEASVGRRRIRDDGLIEAAVAK
ncbi:MAG TPA: hypothetical protein VK633_11465 [Verrucomicrobiae bacterium]|nr:hypothetical protein [Verrucomicrobiae bacterium]